MFVIKKGYEYHDLKIMNRCRETKCLKMYIQLIKKSSILTFQVIRQREQLNLKINYYDDKLPSREI